MALRALAFLRTAVKLAFVSVGRMAILAGRERNLFLEVVFDMTTQTCDLRMSSQQWILRFRMIEFKTREHSLPAAGGVAGIARLRKFATVRVAMACRAGVELHVLIASSAARRIGFVAFLAGDFDMQPSQWVSCSRVIELDCGFPTLDVMTLGAFIAELPPMWVRVAWRAVG